MCTEYQPEMDWWLEQDRKFVFIKCDGHPILHELRCRVYKAIYPVRTWRLDVSAEVVQKDNAYYQKIKKQLGDVWVTDVLQLPPEELTSVMRELHYPGV